MLPIKRGLIETIASDILMTRLLYLNSHIVITIIQCPVIDEAITFMHFEMAYRSVVVMKRTSMVSTVKKYVRNKKY